MDDQGMQINPSWAQFLKDFETPLIFGGLFLLVAAVILAYYVLYRRPGQRKKKSARHSHHSGRKSHSASSLVKDIKTLAKALKEESQPRHEPNRAYQPLGANNLPPLKSAPVPEAGPENRPTGI